MGLISNKISRKDLNPGDHIYSWRTAFFFAHHGIYIGDGKVIHFTTPNLLAKKFGSSVPTRKPCLKCGYHSNLGGVISSCIDCFLAKGDLHRFTYSVSPVFLMAKLRGGTCTTATSDASEQVISRAEYLLSSNGFGDYGLLENNCEDFALYCKTSLVVGENVRLGRSGQATSVSPAMLVTRMVNPLACNLIRLYADIGVRRDVTKVPVERLVARAREG